MKYKIVSSDYGMAAGSHHQGCFIRLELRNDHVSNNSSEVRERVANINTAELGTTCCYLHTGELKLCTHGLLHQPGHKKD